MNCDLCWAEFDTAEELAQHVEIEEALTYSVSGGGYEDDDEWQPVYDYLDRTWTKPD